MRIVFSIIIKTDNWGICSSSISTRNKREYLQFQRESFFSDQPNISDIEIEDWMRENGSFVNEHQIDTDEFDEVRPL